MSLLIDSYREAVTAADEARSPAARTLRRAPIELCGRSSIWPGFSSPVILQSPRPTKASPHASPHAQEAKMPLHYAAASGAPFEVTKLLLECNPEATTAKDKARR